MKIYIAPILSLLLFTTSYAQSISNSSIEKLLDRYEYVKAIDLLNQNVEKDPANLKNLLLLADCYYYTSNFEKAEKNYKKAQNSITDKEIQYRFIQSLRANEKYEEAKVEMKKFAFNYPTDSRSELFVKNENYHTSLLQNNDKYKIKKLNINTNQSEFGSFLKDNTLYFASSRKESTKKYGWNQESFLDLYIAKQKNDSTYAEPTLLSSLNSNFHEGPLCISKDGKTLYFSSESFLTKSFEKQIKKQLKSGQVQIFKAKWVNNQWTEIEALPINSKNYSVSNPSLNSENNQLYFSSNMPGGMGGNDLWKMAIHPDGSYGKPENLGKKWNTEADESFPFVDENNILYFASNGRPGLGGFDVYKGNVSEDSDIEHLGVPINSSKDDFAFAQFNQQKNGFVSSNRAGSDDIYACVTVCYSYLNTIVIDEKSNQPLAEAKIQVIDNNNNVIKEIVADANGKVEYRLACDKASKLKILKDGFITKEINFINNIDPIATTTLTLSPIEEVIVTKTEILLNPIYFDLNRNEINAQAAAILDKLVYIMKENGAMKIYVKSHTDNRGKENYNLKLSENRARATVNYVITQGIDPSRISGKGFGESELLVHCGEKCTENDHSKNRRSEFIIVENN